MANLFCYCCIFIFYHQAFTTNDIVPYIITTAPSKVLEVTYLQSNSKVDLGNELAPKDVLNSPDINYEADPNSYYTLLMIGPDIPTRQFEFLGEWLHWLIINIPGSDVSKGDLVREYMEAGPFPFTGLHRFIFFVYKQPSRLTLNEPYSNNNYVLTRPFFSTKRFAEKYNLGNPIAANFFQAQYDDSVPSILSKVIVTLKMQIPEFVVNHIFLNVGGSTNG